MLGRRISLKYAEHLGKLIVPGSFSDVLLLIVGIYELVYPFLVLLSPLHKVVDDSLQSFTVNLRPLLGWIRSLGLRVVHCYVIE